MTETNAKMITNYNSNMKIKYDGSIFIATGKSRKEIHWKNKELLWSEFIEKIGVPHETLETVEEYDKMTKTQKDNIKDIGGFCGGTLKSGRRKAENVANRTLLTLDIDYGSTDTWNLITAKLNCACAIYSTHSHRENNPRFRLIIPVSRPVLPDEYQAIARMIANEINIEIFDDTTYQAERLMYWASKSKGAQYIFNIQDYKWLDADKVLNKYTFGWKDSSFWPESSRNRGIIERKIKKQGDPLLKDNIVGAFCRTYTITEVLETFLQDEYTPCGKDDRYTYSKGSTSAGLVIYDDKFAFSNHGTDPISGILCNSFDLMRIHKFGDLDEESKIDTPVNKLPSYLEMDRFARNDGKVRKTIVSDGINKAKDDFKENEVSCKTEDEWMEKLEISKQGKILITISNIQIILENDPCLKEKIAINEFNHRTEILSKLPWSKSGFINSTPWSDNDDSGIRGYLEKTYSITGKQKIEDALSIVKNKNSFHPIKEYLNNLFWDGENRVDTLLVDYLGAENNNYVKTVTRKTLVAAIARIFNPGVKFDSVLTLVGKQGIGKSTLFKKLGKDWFSDSLDKMQGKDAYESVNAAWIIELGELAALKKVDLETVKRFITKTEDVFRVSYGKHTSYFKRHCIFVATTNDSEFLKDKTGNRRFWPIDVKKEAIRSIFNDLTEYEIGQIWAESLELYKSGETLFLSEDEEKEARVQQEAHRDIDNKEGRIKLYLDKPLSNNWADMNIHERRDYIQGYEFGDAPEGSILRDRVCVLEIWVELLNGDINNMPYLNSKELNQIMQSMEGWEKHNTKSGTLKFGKIYGPQRAYIRKNE